MKTTGKSSNADGNFFKFRATTFPLLLTCAASLAFIQQACASKIIVRAPGIAGNNGEVLTFKYVKGVAPNKQFGMDTVTLTPAAADVANTTTKATYVTGQINAQSTTTAASAMNIVTVTPPAGYKFAGMFYKPGKSMENLRLNPGTDFGDPPPVEYSLTLDGLSSGSGFAPAELDLGANDGASLPYTFFDDTTGKTASMVLNDFSAMVNANTPFSAQVVGDQLLIDNATVDNDLGAVINDPGFDYSYAVVVVPEPATLSLLFVGGCLLLRLRRK